MCSTTYSIEARLASLVRYRSRRVPSSKDIQLVSENTAQLLYSHHCCSFYSITVRLAPRPDLSASLEWSLFRDVLIQTVRGLQANYLVAGLVVGVEMSEKDSRRTRPNRLAGRPHVHVFLAAYNDFLSPSVFDVRDFFVEDRFVLDVLVNPLPCDTVEKMRQNVCPAMRYPLKCSRDPVLQEACRHYLGMGSVMIYANPRLSSNPLVKFAGYLSARGYPHELCTQETFQIVPSVRRYEATLTGSKLQMAAFIREVCLQQGLAFYGGSLWRRQPPSLYTWSRWLSVSEFSSRVLCDMRLPAAYLSRFVEGGSWALSEGYDRRLGATISVFPTLTFASNLWEFHEGVYDFTFGEFVGSIAPFTSASIRVDAAFESVPFPSGLYAFICDLTKDRREAFRLLVVLGGLFHVVDDRKQQPSLWLHGVNSSYKSWFCRNYCSANFGSALIHTLDRFGGAFRYGSLPVNGSGLIYSDDFRSQDYLKEPGILLNILDGATFAAQQKYAVASERRFRGHFAVTTNERLSETEWSPMDKQALGYRFASVEFSPLPEPADFKDLDHLLGEFSSFGLLANAIYISQRYGRKATLPASWSVPLAALFSEAGASGSISRPPLVVPSLKP